MTEKKDNAILTKRKKIQMKKVKFNKYRQLNKTHTQKQQHNYEQQHKNNKLLYKRKQNKREREKKSRKGDTRFTNERPNTLIPLRRTLLVGRIESFSRDFGRREKELLRCVRMAERRETRRSILAE